ncbi:MULTISPECIES: hypothetical protein [unclassified Streptomyces]|uniref:hypothetical protein n=1 Tax=Streptomyces sp. NPDC059517 TaxID=3346855 RepID=UPI0036945CAE
MNISTTSGPITDRTAGGTAVLATPESELAPLLAAWDEAHSGACDDHDPEWRHLLDEMAHPRTTQAFYRLAASAGS